MKQNRRNGDEKESQLWPSLPLEEWADTRDTLHMWTQVVGKIAIAHAPMINQWWQTTLRVTSRGLATIPLSHGRKVYQIEFDFVDHQLRIEGSGGKVRMITLEPRSVADFYGEVMANLAAMGIEVSIWTRPVEVENPIPFEEDREHASYDREYVRRFWQALVQSDRLFREFRSHFAGKVSPSHFFWGSFDLATTRFSGRRAPAYSGGTLNVGRWVMEEAYSHEVSSLGFWPGSGPIPYPAYYSYAYPAPEGFQDAQVRPEGAFYSADLGEFILPYDQVREAADPDAALLDFAQSTYEAAADLGGWDRAALDYTPVNRA